MANQPGGSLVIELLLGQQAIQSACQAPGLGGLQLTPDPLLLPSQQVDTCIWMVEQQNSSS
jgi:hypothetical protein